MDTYEIRIFLGMKKKIFFTSIIIFSFLILLGALELWVRQMPPSTSFARLLFFNQFKVSRWAFLNERRHELNVDYVINVIASANADFYDQPEYDRPAFDRITEPYLIQTNADGFRDRAFPKKSSKKSIIILGDSVAFGKGVSVKERFSSILQQRFPHTPIYNLSLLGCTADCMAQVLENHIERLDPKLIIFQTSGNDIDQTLWKEGVNIKTSYSPDIWALRWVSSSYLLQKIQDIYGNNSFEILEEHSRLAEEYYAESMKKAIDIAQKNNAKLLSLNLPFAYTWNYGGHFSQVCKKNPDVCVKDVSIAFHGKRGSQNKDNFSTRTATELGMSQDILDIVFPHPDYFIDVVHLSSSGHMKVADILHPILGLHLR